MKRLLSILALAATVTVFAVGPKVPCILTFDPSPSLDVTGYWFYWRTTNGVYSDVARYAIGTNNVPIDLRVLGLPKGRYYVMMTATNLARAESDPTPDVLWDYQNPNKPTNLQIQQP